MNTTFWSVSLLKELLGCGIILRYCGQEIFFPLYNVTI
jgi:hypothetical protein